MRDVLFLRFSLTLAPDSDDQRRRENECPGCLRGCCRAQRFRDSEDHSFIAKDSVRVLNMDASLASSSDGPKTPRTNIFFPTAMCLS